MPIDALVATRRFVPVTFWGWLPWSLTVALLVGRHTLDRRDDAATKGHLGRQKTSDGIGGLQRATTRAQVAVPAVLTSEPRSRLLCKDLCCRVIHGHYVMMMKVGG
jgi:hypothetical protein